MKTTLATIILAAGLLGAAPDAYAVFGGQGIQIQGIQIQATDPNGIQIQGIQIQGIQIQGIQIQGIQIQGNEVTGLPVSGEIIDVDLNGSELEIFARAEFERQEYYYFFDSGELTVLSYDPREGWRVETQPFGRTGSISIEFEVPISRIESVSLRLRPEGFDTSYNTMGSRHHNSNSDVALYKLEAKNSRGGWYNVCPNGGTVVAIAGSWDDEGTYDPDGGISFACSGLGVAAKCIQQWGYKPWKTLAFGPLPVDLEPLFQSCVRAAMADYCGDGKHNTAEGTVVDIFDFYGFNQAASQEEIDEYKEDNNLQYWTPVLESVLGAEGTVAHHKMRYGYGGNLECEGKVVNKLDDQDALWDEVISNLLPWQSADPYGMDWPYIAVRSDTTLWLNPVEINEGLLCPLASQVGGQPCPL